MAKLTYRYSAMNAGKSTMAMQVAYNYEELDGIVLVWKPLIDTKGNNKLVSRIGIERKVDYLLSEESSPIQIIKKELEIKNRIDAIIVDETQFLNENQINELYYISKKMNIFLDLKQILHLQVLLLLLIQLILFLSYLISFFKYFALY